jgi:flagellar hook protein FlgE
LSNMILAQRSFEANAREVAAVSSTLQTLTSLGLVSAA